MITLDADLEKMDLTRRWLRSDRAFFAKGGCHILAHAFLRRYGGLGFGAMYIQPGEGFRGSHVFVTDGEIAFDWHGYTWQAGYLEHTLAKLRRSQPGWQGELIPIEGSLIGPEFCRLYKHRMPHQFFQDPTMRAAAYLDRFADAAEIKKAASAGVSA